MSLKEKYNCYTHCTYKGDKEKLPQSWPKLAFNCRQSNHRA